MQKQYKDNFKQFFNHYYEELVIYAESYLFNRAASEDLVQEIFIYLWENSDKVIINKSSRAYLYVMVRNRCINYLKTVKITDDLSVLELIASFDNHYQNDEMTEERKRQYEHIMGIVEQMPVKMQEIFQLKYFKNYKYSEIASELKISLNTVKTQLQRARQKIMELIH